MKKHTEMGVSIARLISWGPRSFPTIWLTPLGFPQVLIVILAS